VTVVREVLCIRAFLIIIIIMLIAGCLATACPTRDLRAITAMVSGSGRADAALSRDMSLVIHRQPPTQIRWWRFLPAALAASRKEPEMQPFAKASISGRRPVQTWAVRLVEQVCAGFVGETGRRRSL